MSDWRLYDGPLMQPGMCVCGSQRLPMVDTTIDKPSGRVYLCPTCVSQAAVLHGYVDKRSHDEIVLGLAIEIDDLEAQLAVAVAARVVSVPELMDEIRKSQQPVEA